VVASTSSATHGNQFSGIGSLIAEPVEVSSFVGFFLWSFQCFDRLSHPHGNQFSGIGSLVVEPVETTIKFFPHCGRFDVSTGSTTISTRINDDFT